MSSAGLPGDLPRATMLSKALGPWQPAIDARRNDQPSIISGRNFRDRIDGPCSDWSNEFVNFNLFDTATRAKITELRFDADIFYGTPTGVYRINSTSLIWELILGAPHITVTNTYWPWTMARVGGLYYIAQYDIGLWQWNPTTQTLTQVTTPVGNVIRYVIEHHGRLVFISDGLVAWSKLDDGTSLTPDLATGAGAQTTQQIGTAFRLEAFADRLMIYGSGGIMPGTYTTNSYVYTWGEQVSTVIKIFSPNTNVKIPQIGVVSIDGNGLWLVEEYNYSTFGRPNQWELEKSVYIKENIINSMNRNLYGTIAMYYSQALQCVFICFSSDLLPGFFQTTLVYDMNSKRWSTFDQQHYGIFETYDPTTALFTCAFMGPDGYMRRFSNTDFSEDVPTTPGLISDFVYRPLQTDIPVIKVTDLLLNGGLPYELASCSINGSDNNPFFYSNYTASGLYIINTDDPYTTEKTPWTDPIIDITVSPLIVECEIDLFISDAVELMAVPYVLPSKGLDSNITIGPWRFNDQKQFAEQVSAIESVLLGCQSTNGFEVTEDWNSLSATEDWNALTGNEDWSSGAAILNNYDLFLLDANDAFTTPLQGVEELPVFADLVSEKLYKPMGNSSIYHTLQLEASEVSQSFNLKKIDITATYTGVYLDG